MNHKKNLVTVQTMLLVVNHHTCTLMPYTVGCEVHYFVDQTSY